MRWARNLVQRDKSKGAPLPPLGPSPRRAYGGGCEVGAQITKSYSQSKAAEFPTILRNVGIWVRKLRILSFLTNFTMGN